MARVISVCLPMWPIDRLRRAGDTSAGDGGTDGDGPLILAGSMANRRVVTAACTRARSLGLRPGMAVSKAQAMVPDLCVRPADPQGDLAALERLALWLMQRFAPIVAVDPPDGVVIDATGAAHLHGGEAAMLDAILGRLTLSGITATIAMADTWGAAHALARHAGALTIAPPGTARDALASLPLAALRLAPATVAGLGDMGFRTVGDLMAVPRAPLTRRFGPEVTRRLDQALGQSGEPIDPLRPADLATSRRAFAEPIAAAETIARQIGHLVRDLCRQLESRGMGARRLDLICWRVDRAAQTLRVGLAAPQRDPARLTRLLTDKIPTIDPGFGIEIMSLTATLAEPLAPRQAAGLLE
ncbi:MAG: DNA polymerase Y family protein, partial [Paracoccus sp. (in: a-proteobacteria)]|nr:DNA polymerase Y family protein [Paracoccus sp. (in: a-proteobacteria)]